MLIIFHLLLTLALATDHYLLIEDSRNEEDFKSHLDVRCTFDKKLDVQTTEGYNIYRVLCPFNQAEMISRSINPFSDHETRSITEDRLSGYVAKRISDESLMAKVTGLRQLLGYNDEFFPKQFALGATNTVQGASVGFDMNVLQCHKRGFKGKGVVVVVLDDGCQISHPEISENFDTKFVHSFSTNEKLDSEHGTACAGLIAAKANNNLCVVGIAPDVTLGVYKILDVGVYASDEANALAKNHVDVDVYSNSWGPVDDGYILKNLEPISLAAQATGVSKGRKGKGSIYTFANGNGGLDDSCGADGVAGSPYVMSIQSIEEGGNIAFYGEACAHIMTSSYVGDAASPTIELDNRCQETFRGTSAATPMISASVALILDANPKLTWRDVHHVVARASKVTQYNKPIWQSTPAGLFTSSILGFGVLDVSRALFIAQKWKNVGPLCISENKYSYGEVPLWTDGDNYQSNSDILMEESEWKRFLKKTTYIPNLMNITSEESSVFSVELAQTGKYAIPEQQGRPELKDKPCSAEIVEWLILEMKTIHACRGSLTVTLTSPAGTVSVLLNSRKFDYFAGPFTHRFKVLQPMGEKTAGVWKLRVTDNGICDKFFVSTLPKGYRGHVTEISVTAFATSTAGSAYSVNKDLLEGQMYRVAKKTLLSGKTIIPTADEVASAIEDSLEFAYNADMDPKIKV